MKLSKLTLAITGAALLGTALTLVAPAQAQDYYTWKDARGNKVISDRPPENPAIDYEHVRGAFGKRKDAPDKPAFRPRDELPQQAQDRAAVPDNRGQSDKSERGKGKPEKADKDPNPAACEAARERLWKLETFPQSRTTDDSGEVRFMTDEEREQQKSTNQKLIDKHCDD